MDACKTCNYRYVYAGKIFCRRYPPLPKISAFADTWPTVSDSDWCGEYTTKVTAEQGSR